jgi:hypothetical protein
MSVFRFSSTIGLSMLGAVFTGNASALDMNNIPAGKGTTPNHTFGDKTACHMTVKEYFSEKNLVSINAQLGKLNEWIHKNDFFDESVLHDYLDTEEDDFGIKAAVFDAFVNIKGITSIYSAGTPEGLAYLKSDVVGVIGTIYAYTGYAEMLKSMLMDIGAEGQLDELKQLDKTIAGLNLKADTTEKALVVKMTQQCPMALSQN